MYIISGYARLLTYRSTHIYTSTVHCPVQGTGTSTLLKKKARGVLGLRGVTAQGVLWQHTRVLS